MIRDIFSTDHFILFTLIRYM